MSNNGVPLSSALGVTEYIDIQ